MSQIKIRNPQVIVRIAVIMATIILNILVLITFVAFPLVPVVITELGSLITRPSQYAQMSTIQILAAVAQVMAVIVLIFTLIWTWRHIRPQMKLLAAQCLYDVFDEVIPWPIEAEYRLLDGQGEALRAVYQSRAVYQNDVHLSL